MGGGRQDRSDETISGFRVFEEISSLTALSWRIGMKTAFYTKYIMNIKILRVIFKEIQHSTSRS